MLDSLLGQPGAAVDRALNHLADTCVDLGISANALTYGALVAGVGAGFLFAAGWAELGFAAVLLSGTSDAIDGRVARRGTGSSVWGGVMDLTFDRIVEVAVLLGLALPWPERHVPALVLAATWYVNLCVFLAIGAASNRASEKVIHYAPGLLERSELLILVLVVVVRPTWAPLAVYVYAFLGVITAAQRFAYGRKVLVCPS